MAMAVDGIELPGMRRGTANEVVRNAYIADIRGKPDQGSGPVPGQAVFGHPAIANIGVDGRALQRILEG